MLPLLRRLRKDHLVTVLTIITVNIIIITLNIIIIITLLRRQRKDKNGHSPQGSVLGYSDPANEKLLPGPRNGTINHR